MIVADPPIFAGGFFGTSTDQGVSTDAEAIREQLVRVLKGFYETLYIRDAHRKAHEQLAQALGEASIDNWDGYGAKRVISRAAERATSFLRSLPSNVPSPEVGVDPDGEVSFEWHTAPGQSFSVSIGEGDVITYAGIKGRRTFHGTETLVDEPPKAILQLLGRTLVE